MEFRILGPLEVERDGQLLALEGQRQQAVLALLLLRANEVVSSDRLIDELWGEHAPRAARASLQNAVSALRKLLGQHVLVTRPPGYLLAVADGSLDQRRFERLVAEARAAGDAAQRSQLLSEALSLWRGEPLAGLEFEAFASAEIRRLQEERLAAYEDLFDAQLECGRHTELVGELERLARQHPLRERLRGQLMLALYRSGRQADALSAYQDARRALVEEIGVEPGPRLQRLHAAVLRQERTLDPDTERPGDGDHFEEVARALVGGRVVVVLGVDPTQVASRLATRFDVPSEAGGELTRVAQYVALFQGPGPLYDALHADAAEAVPSAAERFVASIPRLLRERGASNPLLVTTGYDSAVDRALLEAGETFDTVCYLAGGHGRGRFRHIKPDGSAVVVEVPNTYAAELSPDHRTVLLQLGGGSERSDDRESDSFVVTEDDFIGYLADQPLATGIPVGVAARLRRSHLLFLGLGVSSWSLRTVLARVWGDAQPRYRSWAVADAVSAVDAHFWRARGVDVLEHPLDDYVETLANACGVSPDVPR